MQTTKTASASKNRRATPLLRVHQELTGNRTFASVSVRLQYIAPQDLPSLLIDASAFVHRKNVHQDTNLTNLFASVFQSLIQHVRTVLCTIHNFAGAFANNLNRVD
jgi:hypothetical protein